ncbi:putative drug exporter of the RND superfamily [Nakamurella panacisegetis]|uniref:Putative drug exporter of the RND superfamily n=1 Tax=Nakamurella panacisegetis TaxID=1090615 RepID=A0A1H0L4B5_9ACTN|nr:MMPL family transporter [Nakamurella panacisegetis]SDO62876.1 putative drug exporter of the RND superfamily [Nakamurella panacisegetis]
MTDTQTTPATTERPPRRLPRGFPFFGIIAVAVLAFLAGGFGGSYQGKLSSVSKSDNSSYLPASAESTQAGNEAAKFSTSQSLPGFLVFQRESGLTAADKAAIATVFGKVATAKGVDAQAVTPVVYAKDGTAASIYAPLIAKQNGVAVNGDNLSKAETDLVDLAKTGLPDGLTMYPAGPGGLLVALLSAFGGLDGTLLIAAGGVVILILLLVYRSPVLWFFPLFSAVLALGLSSLIIYFLAKNDVLTLTGQSQGILSVLVLGAGTDYALLLVSRYREELHNYEHRSDAMIKAWKESAPAIFASGATVIIGLLCLSFSELNSNKSLGPVAAIGIACTLLVMMTFLPVALASAGRWVFWPRRPTPATPAAEPGTSGIWGAVARFIGTHHRRAWIGAGVLLLLCLVGIGSLKTSGLTTAQGFTNTPDAVVGQRIYDAKFDKGAGAPAVIAVNADQAAAVIAVVEKVPGVQTTPGSVCVQVDYAKLAELKNAGGSAPAGATTGCAPAALQVRPIDGRTIVNAVLADSYDSQAAYDTITRLRTAVHAVPGAGAQVGGQSAATLDVHTASVHDRNLIIPIVLVVILIVLSLLLRAILAPLLLIVTVLLSFGATLGVCGFVFNHVFGFAGADQSFPLFAFVFLVALGIDYNIFLMTRVREETLKFGTRAGVLRGLSVTGGVITSAGVVLAATFAVLGVLPLVFLAELGFAVAFGVLLDTIIVRSILVPALAHDIGRKIWWPSKLAAGKE